MAALANRSAFERRAKEPRLEHRRADRRYDRRLEVEIAVDGTSFQTYTRNVSLGGVYLIADRPVRFGSKVKLKFVVPTQPEPIEVEGEVRWVESADAGTQGIGIQFGGLRARDVWALNKFFETVVE
jgi:uncharacterized protein (TIGR02266 family)